MQVGDLVRCKTVDGNPIGLIVSQRVWSHISNLQVFSVSISGKYQGKAFDMRGIQLEVVSASR